MLIVLIAQKDSDSGFGLTILEYSRIVYYSELPIPSCEHLRWTHLEQMQHCTDLPRQVTFSAHTEQGKMGPWLG